MTERQMRCPFCGAGMELGMIQNGQVIYWRPGTDKRFFGDNALQKGAVILPGASFLFGSRVISFFCRTCNKIVIDCSDPASGEPQPDA